MAHERSVFEAVAAARAGTQAVADEGPSPARFAAERQLGVASAGLVAVAEAYPQLRASEAAAELIAALKDVEGDLRRARMVYNRTVQTYEERPPDLPQLAGRGRVPLRPPPLLLRLAMRRDITRIAIVTAILFAAFLGLLLIVTRDGTARATCRARASTTASRMPSSTARSAPTAR